MIFLVYHYLKKKIFNLRIASLSLRFKVIFSDSLQKTVNMLRAILLKLRDFFPSRQLTTSDKNQAQHLSFVYR